MSLSSIGPICIWLMISVSVYTGLWLTFVRRFGTFGILLFNLAYWRADTVRFLFREA